MSKPVFLEVDPSIVERNLQLTEDSDTAIDKIFNVPNEKYPSKLVKPVPGFCVKSREIGTETKVFINVCKTDAIPPPPKHITEDELAELLESDEVTEYRVPMSIGEMRTEPDKKGEEAKVCDVAINDIFFVTLEKSQMFRNFVMSIIFEAISNKHKVFATDERILMKQRKVFGNLQVHRIQDRDAAPINLPQKDSKAALIEEISANTADNEIPNYILYKKKNEEDAFYADISLPKVTSSKELTLDVGEDRIILESSAKKYLLDIFIPLNVYPSKVNSFFNIVTKILTVKMHIQTNL
ncbi:hypothetical protein Trydic_g15901 [Trypoxylus dichotomus]